MVRCVINGAASWCRGPIGVERAQRLHIVALEPCELAVRGHGVRTTVKLNPGGVFARELPADSKVEFSDVSSLNASEKQMLQDTLQSSAGKEPAAAPKAAETAMLLAAPGVNVFETQGETHFVLRKAAKPRYHRRCPRLSKRAGVRQTLQRAIGGETPWKQCGATFSTMMRHFQKQSDIFAWQTDCEKQTTIRAIAC